MIQSMIRNIPLLWRIAGGVALLTLLVGALVWFANGRGQPLTIIDGQSGQIAIRSHAETVGDALREANILVRPADQINPPLITPLDDVTTITILRAERMQVVLNGQAITVYTRATTLRGMLADAGHTLGPADVVRVAGVVQPPEAWDAPLFNMPDLINVESALALTIFEGENSQTLVTSAATVGLALAEAGYPLYLSDGISPPLWTPLRSDQNVVITRAREVRIEADGQTLTTRSHGNTVGAVLAEVGLALVGGDYTQPAFDAPVPADGLIRVVRTHTAIITEQYPIAFQVQWQPVETLPLDETSLVQAGQPGIQARRVRVYYENGVEVGREVEAEWQVRAPTDEVRGYGTKIEIRTLNTPDGPIEYWRSATFYAVSYSPARSGTPRTAPWYGMTRSGKILRTGMIAVDTNVIRLGTQLYIPGYGFASAEDTGGGVRGRLIDLGYTDEEYVSWHEYVTVYWLTPVPPADQIVWRLP